MTFSHIANEQDPQIHARILADVRTTLSAFERLRSGEADFIFDSTGLVDDDGQDWNIAPRVDRAGLEDYEARYVQRFGGYINELMDDDQVILA